MRKSLFLLLFSPIFIAAQLQPKTQTYTISGRNYDVTTPSNYSASKQYPIIFELHSFNQDRNQMHNQDLVDELQYISVRPEGNMVSNYRAWNSWSVTNNLGLENDVEYIKNVYNDVKTRLSNGFNPQKVYVYGFSNGGAMAMKMLEETDLFKAALIRSMSFEEGHTISSSAAKVPMIFVHGIADEVVPTREISSCPTNL
ncbi:CE1 family esterase [Riemerella anatipestifer]|uniref:alpha/beta hydrolase family esterase n=1 Tax=Riemerella anatipestifer TaxID=34085 RepID=UPI0021AAE14F|nr:dienelactone hydrolase family protein [Riemerella anatipestifer]